MARKDKKEKPSERDDSKDLKGGPGKYSRKLAAYWIEQIEDVEDLNKVWYKRGDQVIKRYRDDRKDAAQDGIRRLNTLWANYKTLMPALYGKPPIPIVERRFLQRDVVARTSSIILERNLKYQMEVNGLHSSVKRAVSDYLLPGRGQCWIRYEPEIGEGPSLAVSAESSVEDDLADLEDEFGDGARGESDESEKLESTGEQVLAEQCPVDYINWKDFLMIPARARTWDEVQAVAKRVHLSREEAKERFGEEIGESMQPDTEFVGDRNDSSVYTEDNIFHDINERSLTVYEIWNKSDRRVYWVSKGYQYLCDAKDDPLKLKKFFPCPEPINSTLTNDSLIPVPDYWEYQDQAIQIDEITQRLALLTKACKVAGTYDGSNGALKRLLQEGFENDLLPVDSWAAFAEKGGVKGGISFLPIDEIQKVIDTLQKTKQLLMQDLDLITGITDVNRGTTDSRETLGGIRLKNNNAGTRLSDRQNEIARFAKDILCICAEIVAKHFDDKTLIEASGILFDDDMQPETILEEMQPSQQAQQQQGASQLPQQGTGGPPMLPPPGQGQPPVSPPGQQNGGGNIIPFPQQENGPQIPMGMPQQSPQMQQIPLMPMPPPINPIAIIEKRLTKALDLLRKEVPLGYRIDIETDSTIFGDAAQERQDATEFITATTQFLNQAATLGETIPESTPLFGRMLQWGVRKFRVGRDLESAIDDFVRKMDKKVKDMAKNPQMSPEQIQAQADQQANAAKLQQIQMQTKAQEQKVQMEFAAQQANDQRDAQKQQMEDARDTQIAQMEMQHKEKELAMEMEFKTAEHAMKMEQLRAKSQADQNKVNADMAATNMKMHAASQQHEQTAELNQQQHQQTMQLNQQQHAQKQEQVDLQAKTAQTQHKQKMTEAKHSAAEKDKARKDKAKAKPKGKVA